MLSDGREAEIQEAHGAFGEEEDDDVEDVVCKICLTMLDRRLVTGRSHVWYIPCVAQQGRER